MNTEEVSAESIEYKNRMREEIRKATEEFLNSGKKIEQVANSRGVKCPSLSATNIRAILGRGAE